MAPNIFTHRFTRNTTAVSKAWHFKRSYLYAVFLQRSHVNAQSLLTSGVIFRIYTQSCGCLTLSCFIFACTSHSEKCSMLVSWRSISVSHTSILSRAVSNSSLWLMKCCVKQKVTSKLLHVTSKHCLNIIYLQITQLDMECRDTCDSWRSKHFIH